MRARWEEGAITAGELLGMWRDEPPFLDREALSRIEAAKKADRPPEDKWNAR